MTIAQRADSRTHRVAATLLVVYGIVLALIALWPSPVDEGAGPMLRAITRVFPFLTYGRIEFAANIVLFIPLGLLLGILLARYRYLVLPVAIVVTVTIELLQAVLLDRRTPSVGDIIANATGACIGLLLLVAILALSRRRGARDDRSG